MTVTAGAANGAVEEALAIGARLHRRYLVTLVAGVVVLLVAATLGMALGSVRVPAGDVWSIVLAHVTGAASSAASGVDTVIWQIRAPRVVMAALVGAGLAVIGVAVQAMVRNPLADPYVLGVESGAAAGAVAVIFFLGALGVSFLTPSVGAFIGATITLVVVFSLARIGGRVSSLRLLLVGVALSYGLSGFTSFVLYSSRDPMAQSQVVFWILGGLGGTTWGEVPAVVAALAVAAAIFWSASRRLNALAMGDDSATSLGIDPDRLRVRLFVVCSLAIAVIVSVVGPIGFVGLVIPHVARILVGADHRRLVPVSLLLGAIYLVAADTVARTLFAPAEIPVGVVTAVLGTPFFLLLIRRRGAGGLREGG
ncbi:MAG: iron ABC transporter permease [Chloroflexota bacterium]